MKTNITLPFSVIFIFILNCPIFSQQSYNGWTFVNSQPYPDFIAKSIFINENTGYNLYNYGTIFKTTDKGDTWNYHSYVNTSSSPKFSIVENTDFYVIRGSLVYKSTNECATWSTLQFENALQDIYFINKNTGFAGGNQRLLKTTNAGNNWFDVITPATQYLVYMRLYFLNSQTGFAITSNGKIFKTVNQGQNWYQTQTPSADNYLLSITFANDNTGYACGEGGTVFKTTNSGENWFSLMPLFNNTSYNSAIFFNNLTGYLSCYYNNKTYALTTTDGGNTWNPHIVSDLYGAGATKIGNTHSLMYGGYGQMSRSEGIGNWVLKSKRDYSYRFFGFDFINENSGFAINDSLTILKTTNAGNTWDSISDFSKSHNLEISFVSLSTGFAFGSENFSGIGRKSRLYRTSNGGQTWTRIMLDTISETFETLSFPTETTGYISADNLYRTTNAGLNWTFVQTLTPYREDMFFVNANTGYSLNVYGYKLYKTTNGGVNWFTLKDYSATEYFMLGPSFINQNTGVISVIDGAHQAFRKIVSFYKTINGGETWDSVAMQQNIGDTYKAFFLNQNTGFLSGTKFHKTTNGGYTWIEQAPLSIGAKDIYFYNENLGIIYGLPGLFIRTTNGGAIFVNNNNENFPSGYKLNQNFPNPFNPSTIISFSLPKNDFVKVKIYDITGKLISEILNEYKSIGYYEINFDASNLSSGMYFYKIETADFTQTKKMVLLK